MEKNVCSVGCVNAFASF